MTKRRPAARPVTRTAIRRLTKKDGAKFLSLIDALADYEKLDRPDAGARRRLLRDLAGPARRFEALLAVAGGEAVGYAVFFETYSTFLARPTLYLEDLFVLPSHRGHGTGLKLFSACVAEARRRGCGRMDWSVLDWNAVAVKFYKKLGATHLREWHLYRLGRKDFARVISGPAR